jgi:hypothetical protein
MFPHKIIAATPVSTVPAKMLISPFSNVIVLVVLVVLVEALNTFRDSWPKAATSGA